MGSETGTMAFVKVLVADGACSARFYEALGFERTQSEPPFIHLRWAESADLYLVATSAGAALQGRRGLGVLVGFRAGPQGLDAVVARALKLGVDVEGPTLQPWHTREILLTDPDGYRLNFIEPA